MKRWLFLALALCVVIASVGFVLLRLYFASATTPKAVSHLIRVPNSAYKYHLCSEAFAFALATADNPYKTDNTFHDPFRNDSDTIIPRFLGFDIQHGSLSFSVKMIIDQVGTFDETITNIQGQDGIAILIPNTHNQLQQSSVPQFIISMPNGNNHATVAVLDYTCPEQWVWSAMHP